MPRWDHQIERNKQRDRMASRLATAAKKDGIKTRAIDHSCSFEMIDEMGEQYRVTVTYKREQDRQ